MKKYNRVNRLSKEQVKAWVRARMSSEEVDDSFDKYLVPKEVAELVKKITTLPFEYEHALWNMKYGVLSGKLVRRYKKKGQRLKIKGKYVYYICLSKGGCAQLDEEMEKAK